MLPQPVLPEVPRCSQGCLFTWKLLYTCFNPAPAQLAKGTCMAAFTWNGGGGHQGQWTVGELPTDSALVLYLFAAFLDAPGWQFGAQVAGSSGAGADSMLDGGSSGTAG